MAADGASYKVKTVTFLGRRVPIMLQDINGPCPLLAIANVLLLRNQLQLPAGVGEVSQERLVAMVAERLIDSNSQNLEEHGAGDAAGGEAWSAAAGGLSEVQRASLAHNLSDAIGLLPKLTTGIDVNLRFHDIAGFEYTGETAVFDLLDIPLVHGWLVDPQDEPTARAVGSKTYNQLVDELITALGSAATPKQLTPTGSLRSQQFAAASAYGIGGSEGVTPRCSSIAGASGALPAIIEQAEGAAAAAQQAGGQLTGDGQQRSQGQRQAQGQEQLIDAETLSAALRDSLRLSLPQQSGGGTAADGEAGSSGPASAKSGAGAGVWQPLGESSRVPSNMSSVSVQTSDSMRSMVNRLLTDVVADTFSSGTPMASRSPGQALQGGSSAAGSQGGGSAANDEGGEEATSALRPGSGAGSSSDLVSAAGTGAAGGSAWGVAFRPAEAAPLLPLGSAGGSQEWTAELCLAVDDAAAEGEAGGPGAGPVRVHLVLRPRQPQPPASPFDLSPSPSGSTSRQGGTAAGSSVRRSTPATPHPSCASMAPDQQEASSAAPAAASAGAAPAAAGQGLVGGGGSAGAAALADSSASSPAGEAAVRDALLAQQFLEGHPSQLTYHGLVSLQEGLRPNQLAVFFRNNHFNTMFKGPDGQLYILCTDEGFQFESDVVWEHLISVDGDTALVAGDFRPFQPHASQDAAAASQAAAREEDWAAAAAAAAAAGGDTHDADLALAMQLQAEEEERVRQEQERRRQQLARQQQEQQQQEQQQQQQQVLPSQRRPSSAGSSGSSRRKKEKKSSSESSCSVM